MNASNVRRQADEDHVDFGGRCGLVMTLSRIGSEVGALRKIQNRGKKDMDADTEVLFQMSNVKQSTYRASSLNETGT